MEETNNKIEKDQNKLLDDINIWLDDKSENDEKNSWLGKNELGELNEVKYEKFLKNNLNILIDQTR